LLWIFFEIESHFKPRPAGTVILLLMLLLIAGITGVHHQAYLLVEMGAYKLFVLAGLEL
jgi:hypothetical protein